MTSNRELYGGIKPVFRRDFVITSQGNYVGFHLTNNKHHPIYGCAKNESIIDCARMLKEEYGDIVVAADVKDAFKYGIDFRELTPKDAIYINKLKTLMKREQDKELGKLITNMRGSNDTR